METIMLDVNVFALVDYIIKFNNSWLKSYQILSN